MGRKETYFTTEMCVTTFQHRSIIAFIFSFAFTEFHLTDIPSLVKLLMFEFPTEMIVVEVEVVTLNGFQSILIKNLEKFAENIYFQQQNTE